MTKPPTLPKSCSDCVYRISKEGHCQRHAISPGVETFEIARWPLVRSTDRCGAGAAVGDGTGPCITQCGWCVHWLQPNGQGVKPDYRSGLSKEWWEQSGYCTRMAPSPSTEENRRTEWRVTNARDGCGDGVRIEEAEEDIGHDHWVPLEEDDVQAS